MMHTETAGASKRSGGDPPHSSSRGLHSTAFIASPVQSRPQFGEEIPTIRQNNSAGLFFGKMLPSHQGYGPGPPNTLSLWLLCCQGHVETLIS